MSSGDAQEPAHQAEQPGTHDGEDLSPVDTTAVVSLWSGGTWTNHSVRSANLVEFLLVMRAAGFPARIVS